MNEHKDESSDCGCYRQTHYSNMDLEEHKEYSMIRWQLNQYICPHNIGLDQAVLQVYYILDWISEITYEVNIFSHEIYSGNTKFKLFSSLV